MKICFVVEDIYPTLSSPKGIVKPNGRAIILKNIGRGLSNMGYDISYITMDYGQPEAEKVDGFTIYKLHRPNEGIPGLRFLLKKVPKLLRALKKADADIYAFACPDSFVGIISRFCRRKNKKFVFLGMSDKDFESEIHDISLRDLHLFKYGLRNSDLVVCQNDYQLQCLKKNYNKNGVILYTPMDSAEYTYDPTGSIIWVGNYRPVKRPEMFIELSKKINDKFIMIGGKAGDCAEQEYRHINSSATNDNINILGSLDYDETDRLISRAKLLVNTSESEGFSATFLQAWRRGIPVVSFVDPDDVIKKNNLGRVVHGFNELISAVNDLRKGISPEDSKKIKDFFDRTFTTNIIAAKFDKLLKVDHGRNY